MLFLSKSNNNFSKLSCGSDDCNNLDDEYYIIEDLKFQKIKMMTLLQ